jgi:small subunit ribosomal protein S19
MSSSSLVVKLVKSERDKRKKPLSNERLFYDLSRFWNGLGFMRAFWNSTFDFENSFVYISTIPHRGLFIAYMSRSTKKGPFVDAKLLKKVSNLKPSTAGVIKTWARRSQISPEMIGFTFGVHNGRQHVDVLVSEEMIGHRLGEFSPTKKFLRHGGKMQKEMEQKKQEAEIASAKAAKEPAAAAKK